MSAVVVLEHLARQEIWAPVLADLRAAHPVTFLDVPGFGDTPLPFGQPPSVESMASSVFDTLADRRLVDSHLVGVSMAGSVALEVARLGGIRSATAISPAGFWSVREAATIVGKIGSLWAAVRTASPLLRLAGRSSYLRARVWREIVAYPARVPRDVADAVVLGMATNMRHITARPPDLRALAGSITGYRMRAFASDVPLTIVWGELDRFTPYSTNAERARQLFPTATHVTLPGCGHLPFYDDPELVSSVLLEAMSDG